MELTENQQKLLKEIADSMITYAKERGVSKKKAEKLWERAEEKAKNKDDLSKEDGSFYKYATSIFKKMVKGESDESINEEVNYDDEYDSLIEEPEEDEEGDYDLDFASYVDEELSKLDNI